MRKRTHKRRALGDVSTVITSAPSIAEAARRLDVDRTTVYRWVRKGLEPAPGSRPARPAGERPDEIEPLPKPQTWMDRMRVIFNFSCAETEILQLAQAALDVAHNRDEPAATRLRAMSEFRAAVKQLALPSEDLNADSQKTRHGAA